MRTAKRLVACSQLLLAAVFATEAAAQRPLRDLDPTGSGTPASFTAWRGATYLEAFDSRLAPGTLLRRLWRTDGTPRGTGDLTPAGVDWRFVIDLTPTHDLLFFVAESDAEGRELWTTDGTPGGTRRVVEIGPGAWSGVVDLLCAVGDTAYFTAATPLVTPLGTLYERNRELWRSDGTAAGTHEVVDLTPGWTAGNSNITDLIPFRGQLYFLANPDNAGRSLWVSDGTATGTRQVLARASIVRPTVMGDLLYFLSQGDLWVTDGTAAGTRFAATGPFANVWAGDSLLYLEASGNLSVWDGRQHTALTSLRAIGLQRVLGDRLWFRGRDTTHGSEPWTSDGTVVGTHMVRDIAPGSADGIAFPDRYANPNVFEWAGSDERVVFTGDDGTGMQVWISDGTAAGTMPLTTLSYASPFHGPVDYHRHGSRILFRCYDSSGDQELWVMDVAQTGSPLAESYGVGCGAAGGPAPAIGARGSGVVGDPAFAVTLSGAGLNTPSALLFGVERADPAWDGCTLAVAPLLFGVPSVTDGSGAANLPLPVPNQPSLQGVTFTTQWATLDPAGGYLGAARLSDGLLVVVGG